MGPTGSIGPIRCPSKIRILALTHSRRIPVPLTVENQQKHGYNIGVMYGISHDMNEESIEAKVRWFRSLSGEERMDDFCEFMDLIFELRPELRLGRDTDSYKGKVKVLLKE